MRRRWEKTLSGAADWLWRSGVFIDKTGSPTRGGVCAGYDSRSAQYGSVYHEITGYAISSALCFARRTGDPAYEDFAGQSARHLLLQQLPPGVCGGGGFPKEMSPDGKIADARCFSFDAGMIVDGLLDLYERCREEWCLNSACRAGHWLVSDMQREDGSFRAYVDASTGAVSRDSQCFDGDGGCLHAKLAVPLLRLAAITGESKFERAAKRLLAWAEGLQDRDGAFWANGHRRHVFAHSHCYAVEGFLYAAAHGHWSARPGLRGVHWLARAQTRDGAVCRTYKTRLSLRSRLGAVVAPVQATDATAQAVRIWVLADGLGGGPRLRDCAERAVSFLVSLQRDKPSDRRVHGAFPYGRRAVLGVRRTDSRLFTWCTQFAASALMWLEGASDSAGPEPLCQELF